jgi:hypothetical protein
VGLSEAILTQQSPARAIPIKSSRHLKEWQLKIEIGGFAGDLFYGIGWRIRPCIGPAPERILHRDCVAGYGFWAPLHALGRPSKSAVFRLCFSGFTMKLASIHKGLQQETRFPGSCSDPAFAKKRCDCAKP